MSKVFSAKRQKVEFDYEFLDGETKTLNVQSLSSKEQSQATKLLTEKDADVIDSFKKIIKLQLAQNEKSVIDKVVKEQYESGDIVEFSNSIGSLIKEIKEKK